MANNHLTALQLVLDMTPQKSTESAKAVLGVIAEMQSVLAGRDSGDAGAEARGKAYMIALEDVASWAVEAAQRGWYRKEYGSDYDYRWMPDPATLRDLARQEELGARTAILSIGAILEAEPANEASQEAAKTIAERLKGLAIGLRSC
jgi:hypothetical protein